MEKDQRDLLLAFNAQSVRYLIVGAYAVGRYTEPRATKDLNVFIDTAADNADRVFVALARFGAPIQGLTAADFRDPYSGFQFGVPPSQIDIILAISGVSFAEAWEQRLAGRTGDGIEVGYISLEHLIRNKLAAGRLQDLADADALQRARVANATTEDSNP